MNNTLLTQSELSQYSRHFKLPEVGIHGQQRLKNARVLYIGAGGLGSAALMYLAAAGVGTIGIVDDDVIEISNLQRQVIYTQEEVGEKKILAARRRLLKLNSFIQIDCFDTKITAENAITILSQYDVIADGSDNLQTRYIVNDACAELNKMHVYASISQFEGQCSILTASEGPCYRCLYQEVPPPHLMPNCAEGGVLGVLPGIIGSIQALEVIKLILNLGQPLINRLLVFNALEMQFREFTLMKNPDCTICQPNATSTPVATKKKYPDEISVNELAALRQTTAPFILLDVREPFEHQICHLDGILVPLQTLPEKLRELDKESYYVVLCKHGARSRLAVDYMQQQGFQHVSNVTGGICAWAEKIDPHMTKY